MNSDALTDSGHESPLISFLLPLDSPSVAGSALECTVDSFANQSQANFELCVTIDGQVDPSVDQILAIGADWIRIKRRPTPMGRGTTLEDSLRMACGLFVALVLPGDVLESRTTSLLNHELNVIDDVDLAFTDEDEADLGARSKPFYKPGFSPERLRQQNYVGGLLICRRTLAVNVGGFVRSPPGAEEYDFALRASERARRIAHIPQVLYHRSTRSDSISQDAAAGRVRAVEHHLNRTGFPARPSLNSNDPSVIDLEPMSVQQRTVSVVIPTGGAAGPVRGVDTLLVANAVDSVVATTTYSNYELVVVLDQFSTPELVEAIRVAAAGHPLQIVHDTREFNFSKACNLGAIRSFGDLLIFLNDDTEVRSPNWIERLAMYASRPDIGAVGAKLLYGDDRIQQVGIWSREGHPLHRYVGYRRDHPGNRGSLLTAQNCLAVTAACLAVETEKFHAVGGFTPMFPSSFNDVDLCLKLSRSGFRTVVDGATMMYHFESMSRDPSSSDAELEALHNRWEVVLRADPYDNPNHQTDGVEELPLPSDLMLQFDDHGDANYLGRHWPSPSDVLRC